MEKQIAEEAEGSPSLAENIGLGEKLAYGGGDLASNLILTFAGSFLTYFYTDTVGMPIATIGTILLLSRIFDGVSDVFMGFLMDKTRSKHGKARPWLLWLAVPIGVMTVLMVTIPPLRQGYSDRDLLWRSIYIFISYNLISTVLYTAINIPYGALTSLMTRDQYQRSVINIYRMGLAALGNAVVSNVTLPVINALGATQGSWVTLACVYGGASTVLFLVCFRRTKERVTAGNTEAASKIPIKESLKAMLQNGPWLLIGAAGLVVSLAMAFFSFSSIYYAKYILGNDNLVGPFSMATFIPGAISILGMAPFIKKYGKRNAALVGVLIAAAGQAVIYINPASVPIILVSGAIRGFGLGPIAGTSFAMVADTIEYGEWKTGFRVQGMLYSASTFGGKVGSGLGAAAASSLLGAAGYNGLLAVQPASALRMIRVLFLVTPLIAAAALIVCLYLYKLDKIYPQVIADLQARELKEES